MSFWPLTQPSETNFGHLAETLGLGGESGSQFQLGPQYWLANHEVTKDATGQDTRMCA